MLIVKQIDHPSFSTDELTDRVPPGSFAVYGCKNWLPSVFESAVWKSI
jgi:hypothetical protein